MKKLILSLSTFMTLTSTAFATDPRFTVLMRQESSNRVMYREVQMPHLESSSSFDGKYFKIVKAKSNEAVSFNEQDEDLLQRAANAYYHLNLARDYWASSMQSEKAKTLPKITVRVDITNLYDDLGHFAHDNRSPQYNNALSVPEGRTPEWVPEDKQDSWGKEIWFRPMKSIDVKELGPLGPNPLTLALLQLEHPLIDYAQSQFERSMVERVFYPSYSSGSLQRDIIRFAGTVAITKIIISASRRSDRLFIDKYFYLDTAMVPEIIYHEFAHIVLSDHLQMSHSTPVNEGMADYFAATMSKKRKVYGKVPGHSNSRPKDTKEKRTYSHWDESNRMATADFVLSVLWDVRETLGEEVADKLVYQARTTLRTDSATISDHLLRSILNACDKVCEQPGRDKLKLFETFSKKGF